MLSSWQITPGMPQMPVPRILQTKSWPMSSSDRRKGARATPQGKAKKKNDCRKRQPKCRKNQEAEDVQGRVGQAVQSTESHLESGRGRSAASGQPGMSRFSEAAAGASQPLLLAAAARASQTDTNTWEDSLDVGPGRPGPRPPDVTQ